MVCAWSCPTGGSKLDMHPWRHQHRKRSKELQPEFEPCPKECAAASALVVVPRVVIGLKRSSDSSDDLDVRVAVVPVEANHGSLGRSCTGVLRQASSIDLMPVTFPRDQFESD